MEERERRYLLHWMNEMEPNPSCPSSAASWNGIQSNAFHCLRLMDGMEGLGWLFFGGLRAAAAAVLRKERDQPNQTTLPSTHKLIHSLFHWFVLLGLIGAALSCGGLWAQRAIAAQAINPFFLSLFSLSIHSLRKKQSNSSRRENE